MKAVGAPRQAGLRVAMGFATAFAAVFVGPTARDIWWHLHPGRAFAHYTGMPLPDGIVALRYGWAIDDNLFHVGRYWLLLGTRERFDAFARSNDFFESTEEARWTDTHAQSLFGLTLPAKQAQVGYERDAGRGDWIVVFDNGLAIYNEN